MKLSAIINKVLSESGSAFFYTPAYYSESLSYLFFNPVQKLIAHKSDFKSALDEIDNSIKKLSGFGLIDYETGYLLEKKIENLFPETDQPILNFYFFNTEDVQVINSNSIEFPDDTNADKFSINNFKLNASKENFIKALDRIHHYISEGDTYQVNYSIKGKFSFKGDYSAFFEQLIFNQSAKYITFINTGDSIIISLSPELFFDIKDRYISTRPMKGTIQRGVNNQSDSLNRYSLKNSEKNKAENLMILDLLRNDLGRISKFGSVRVRKIFELEKYETLSQMVSEVESELNDNIKFSDIIKNIFPCGSVTGAPKIRTMEIIKELEKESRGIYTGTIGLFHKSKIKFNVAIRTMKIIPGTGEGELGIGSGVVWDSEPEKEYDEVLLKSNFLLNPSSYFELFETMKYEKGIVLRLEDHLERLKDAAAFFLFSFDKEKILELISEQIIRLNNEKDYRLKLILNKYGNCRIESRDIATLPEEIKIIISEKTISTQNRFQYFKTTNRQLYNEEHTFYSAKGFYDVIFINEKNQVAESAISNIFIKKGGLWYTPPVSCGILPGVFRKQWLRRDINVKEDVLYKDDLLIADEIVLTNSLRGKIKVDKLYLNESEYKKVSDVLTSKSNKF